MKRVLVDYKAFSKLARETVGEGCVLLKNDNNTLPIRKGESVSIFGRIQFNYYKSGLGSGGLVNTPYVVSIPDGLRACEGIYINEELEKIYQEWLTGNPFDLGIGWREPWFQQEMPITEEIVKRASDVSDIAIVIIEEQQERGLIIRQTRAAII